MRVTSRTIEWYSILYSTGEGRPSFESSDAVPYLEGGLEVRFGTHEEAVLAIERTPMYLRDAKKAARKFAVVKTSGEIVFAPTAGMFKRFVRDRAAYLQWFEIMYLSDGHSFDAPFQGVEIEPGKPAGYRTFKDVFNALMELMDVWEVPDVERERYNIVWFQSELLS